MTTEEHDRIRFKYINLLNIGQEYAMWTEAIRDLVDYYKAHPEKPTQVATATAQ